MFVHFNNVMTVNFDICVCHYNKDKFDKFVNTLTIF